MSANTYEAVEANHRNLLDVVEAVFELDKEATLEQVLEYSDISKDSAEKALKMAIQLELVKLENGKYKAELPFARLITNAKRIEKKAILKFRLMEYPPFKFFVSLILRNEDATRAASKTKTRFSISGSTTILKNTFLDLGSFARVFDETEQGITMIIKEQPEIISVFETIGNILNDETQIEGFVNNQLDDSAIEFLGDLKDRLISAGSKFPSDQIACIKETADVFEDFLKKIASDASINISDTNGLIEVGNRLKGNSKIASKHQGFINFVGQMRNAFKHTTDSEVGKSWNVSSDLSLEVFLVTLSAINSIVLYYKREECKL
jgi:hypothetical protein